MSIMHNPPHPGQFIKDTYLAHTNMSMRKIAESLDVSASTFNRLVKAQSDVSPEMAFRLAKALGRTPESWLAMQAQYDLWKIGKKIHLNNVHKLDIVWVN